MTGVNVNKLKGRIIEKGLTIAAVAEKMGIDKSSLYRKLGNGGETMLIKDAIAICSVLDLSKDEAVSIFFSQFVA